MKITADLPTHLAARYRRSRARSKPFIRTMWDDFAQLMSWQDRTWRKTANGNEFCLGGWWSTVNCKQCRKVRYAYPRVGFIYRNIDPDGTERYEYRAFKRSSTGHNPRTNALMPLDSFKPSIDCVCLVEP